MCVESPSSGEWCWIVDDNALTRALRYCCFYGPLWLSFVVASCAHFFVWQSLQRFEALAQSSQALRTTVAAAAATGRNNKHGRNALRSGVLAPQQPPQQAAPPSTFTPLPGEPSAVVRRLRASLRHYPVIFLVAWVPASIFRIAQDLGLFGLDGRRRGGSLSASLFSAL